MMYSLLKVIDSAEGIAINYDWLMENDNEFKKIGSFISKDLIDMRDPKLNRNNKELPRIYRVLKVVFELSTL